MLISPAYAQAAAPAAGGDMFMSLLPLILVFVDLLFPADPAAADQDEAASGDAREPEEGRPDRHRRRHRRQDRAGRAERQSAHGRDRTQRPGQGDPPDRGRPADQAGPGHGQRQPRAPPPAPAASSASCWARSKPRHPCSRLPPGARWSWPPSACSAFSPWCPTSCRNRCARPCPAGCPSAPSRSASTCRAAPTSCSRSMSAPVFAERLESMVGDVRAGLRAARIGYRGLGVQGETVTLTLTDPAQRDQALAEIEKLNPVAVGAAGRIRDFDVSDEAGRIVLRLTEAKRFELAPVRDQPVARGGAPPDRRARHARGLDPAPGRGPDPGPGAGREEPGEHQAPARPHRAPDLPHGRPRAPASRRRCRAACRRAPCCSSRPSATGRFLPLSGQAPGRPQRREPDRRAALLPGQPAGGELPLRQCRGAQVRQDHPGECRQAVRDRARRQGDLGPQHPRADPRRLGHHLRQLHGRIGQRAVRAAARRRPAGTARGDRGALGRRRAGCRLRSAPARSPASSPRCS